MNSLWINGFSLLQTFPTKLFYEDRLQIVWHALLLNMGLNHIHYLWHAIVILIMYKIVVVLDFLAIRFFNFKQNRCYSLSN